MSNNDPLLLAEGLEGALIGVAERGGQKFAVYDYNECIRIMAKRELGDGVTQWDAVELAEDALHYNVMSAAYTAGSAPAFLERMDLAELHERKDELG
jgi:hypothetical protein